jgi:hypothetical protein
MFLEILTQLKEQKFEGVTFGELSQSGKSEAVYLDFQMEKGASWKQGRIRLAAHDAVCGNSKSTLEVEARYYHSDNSFSVNASIDEDGDYDSEETEVAYDDFAAYMMDFYTAFFSSVYKSLR